MVCKSSEKSDNPKKSESAPMDDAVPFQSLEEVVFSEVDKGSQTMVLPDAVPFQALEVVSSEADKGSQTMVVPDAVPFQALEEVVSSEVDKGSQTMVLPDAVPFQALEVVFSEADKGSQTMVVPDAVPFQALEEVVSSEVDKGSQTMVLPNDGPEITNPSLSEKVRHDLVNDNQPSENEISLNHGNVTRKISADVNLSLLGDDISASGQGQIVFENCPKESLAILDATNVSNCLVNGSVEIHETSTALDTNPPDPCSDNKVIVSSESSDSESSLEDSTRKEDECKLPEDNESSKLSEDGPIESQNSVVVVEDNAIQCSSPKDRSSDKDAVAEMVKSVSISGQALSHDHSEPSTDETNLLPENELPPLSSTISDTGAAVTVVNDQLGESMPDDIVSSDKGSSISDLQLLSSKSTDKTASTSSIPKNDDSICKKSDSKDDALLDRLDSFVEKSKAIVRTSNPEGTKRIQSTSQGSSAKTLGLIPKVQGPTLPMKKASSVPVVPRVFPGRSSATNNIAKPRTWHRSTSNSSSLPPQPKKAVPGQKSYVRSGSSLAPATASRSSIYKLNPSAPTETRNTAGLGNKRPNTYTRTGGSAAVEENLAVQKVSEDRIGSSRSSERQKTLDEGADGKKIQRVKPKSNQLVAASSSDQSVVELDKTRTSSSDGYYKKGKHQLIRISAGDDSVNTDGRNDSKISIKRHSDEESSTSLQSKRLKIGPDECLRIGNGNQLVSNLKGRTSIFAREKVTARSRLAKKKEYCQFFTRFGKCNQDDENCPYIHDSSKIAVCTKFLNFSCFNTNCKLTHKVIPERMEDCSYYMQGLCTNKPCPYRHVNVNPAASICEGFLKGYCADGDECRKKHTYACPVFEATGACPQGSECKLHHPKNRKHTYACPVFEATGGCPQGSECKLHHPKNKKMGLKKKQKNTWSRYFDSVRGGEAMPISEKH